jgi:hypothetical protein
MWLNPDAPEARRKTPIVTQRSVQSAPPAARMYPATVVIVARNDIRAFPSSRSMSIRGFMLLPHR